MYFIIRDRGGGQGRFDKCQLFFKASLIFQYEISRQSYLNIRTVHLYCLSMFTENLASYDYIDKRYLRSHCSTNKCVSAYVKLSSNCNGCLGLGCGVGVLDGGVRVYFYGVCRPYLDSSLSIEFWVRDWNFFTAYFNLLPLVQIQGFPTLTTYSP